MTDRELLEQLVAEVQGLRAEVERLCPTPSLTRDDRLLLSKLLPAVSERFGDALFTVGDVMASPALRPFCGRRSAKSLGKLFARTKGADIDGYRITPQAEEHGAILWRVASFRLWGLSSEQKAA